MTGLTWQSYEGRNSNSSSKRRCFEIPRTNLLKEFSKTSSTQKHTATTSSSQGQNVGIDDRSVEDETDDLNPFEGIMLY